MEMINSDVTTSELDKRTSIVPITAEYVHMDFELHGDLHWCNKYVWAANNWKHIIG